MTNLIVNGTHPQEEQQMMASRFYHSHQLSRQLAALLGLTRLLNSSYHLEQQLSFILQEANRILEAETSVFYLVKEPAGEIWSHFLHEGALRQQRQPIGDGIAEYVLRTGKIVNVADANTDTRFKTELTKLGNVPVRSFLIVPISNKSGKINGCIQVVNKRGGPFEQKDTHCLMIIADLIALAIQNALSGTRADEYTRLEKDMNRAVEIQRQLMPAKLPALAEYKLFAFNQPSKHIGGDYYDFFPFPRSLSFVLADVSGKGVPAALLTANLHASLHAFANEIDSCKEIVRKINSHFYLYTAADMFATFFWGNLNQTTHRFKYVNAGHIPPMVVSKDGSITRLKSGGPPIGIVDSFDFEEAEITLSRGDTLIIFTDGITDVLNTRNEPFGKSRLQEIIGQNYQKEPGELGRLLLDQVRLFARSSNYPDDMTLIILKRNLT